MEHRDPYRILGVAPDATADEIRTAFRVAARREHPDTAIGSQDGTSVRDIIDAYHLLIDSASRAAYDARRGDDGATRRTIRPNAGPRQRETEPRRTPCGSCGGTGVARTAMTCPACGGAAVVTVIDGLRSGVVRCDRCGGSGRVARIDACGSCRGSGIEPPARR